MTTERLYEFLILAQTLSYSKAAKKLFVTQATLSRHVIEMEQTLGISLLDRTTHGVRLTEAGKVLMHSAADILRQSDAANARLRLADVQAAGTVAVACSEAALCHSFLSFVHLFSEKYREIDLKVSLTNTAAPPVGSVDFAFSPFEYPSLASSISSRVAFTDAAYLAVPDGHRLLYERQTTLSALKGETLIVPYGDELLCSFAANRQLAERCVGNKLNILKTDNAKTALLLVNLGKGVAIVPQYLTENAVVAAKIIGIVNPECKFEVFEYWDENRNNPAARLFHEELESFMAL